MSHRTAIYYVDLAVREGLSLEDAITDAIAIDTKRKAGGYRQTALDEAARLGFKNGNFEEDDEEIATVVEEFFSSPDAPAKDEEFLTNKLENSPDSSTHQSKSGLLEKLDQKLKEQKMG